MSEPTVTHVVRPAPGKSAKTRDDSQPTSVYLYYDATGVLLYVGITSRGKSRNREHNRDKDWWGYVARQEVEHLPSTVSARAREAELIQRFHPPFNTQHNPDHVQVRDAYVEAGLGGLTGTMEDAQLLMRDLGRKLPLIPKSHRPVRDGSVSFTFRTEPQHFAIGTRLAHAKHVNVLDVNGTIIGNVQSILTVGPLASIKASFKAGLPCEDAVATVWQPSTKDGGTFGLRNIKLAGAVSDDPVEYEELQPPHLSRQRLADNRGRAVR